MAFRSFTERSISEAIRDTVEYCWAEIAASMSARRYLPITSVTIQIDATAAHRAPATSRVLSDCHERLVMAWHSSFLFFHVLRAAHRGQASSGVSAAEKPIGQQGHSFYGHDGENI
jgi:hypothetical protein